MPWEMRTVEKQREAFVEAVSSGKKSIAAVCREFGISRKTGYKWIKRAAEGQRLCDQSRCPHRQPSKTVRTGSLLKQRLRWKLRCSPYVLRTQRGAAEPFGLF